MDRSTTLQNFSALAERFVEIWRAQDRAIFARFASSFGGRSPPKRRAGSYVCIRRTYTMFCRARRQTRKNRNSRRGLALAQNDENRFVVVESPCKDVNDPKTHFKRTIDTFEKVLTFPHVA